jgi:3-hydroxyacyl-[acyl-carrier-protein] dehydratase
MRFRLVDRILDWSPHARIRGVKTVSFEEYSLKTAFGDEGWLPPSLLLESFLQLGNWLILLSSDFQQMGVVVKIGRVEFPGGLRLGETVQMDVTLRRGREDGFLLSGEGRVGDRTIISGLDCLAVPVPAGDYVDPEDLRVLFSEIGMPARNERDDAVSHQA